jgi:hypothetical protein
MPHIPADIPLTPPLWVWLLAVGVLLILAICEGWRRG